MWGVGGVFVEATGKDIKWLSPMDKRLLHLMLVVKLKFLVDVNNIGDYDNVKKLPRNYGQQKTAHCIFRMNYQVKIGLESFLKLTNPADGVICQSLLLINKRSPPIAVCIKFNN